jgi:predicted nucleic acid-binding protein
MPKCSGSSDDDFSSSGPLRNLRPPAAVRRLGLWHLHRASVAPLVTVAWKYRHNMTAADALCVALSAEIGGDLLTDDYKLVASPNFPPGVNVLQSSVRS